MNKNIHVAHIIEPMEHGVFIWVIDMANRLVSEGYRVTVLHSIRRETPKNWRELFDSRVELIHVQMTRAIAPWQDFKALVKLTRELHRLKPDIIHTHSSKGGFLARAAGFLLRKNDRLLYTSHAIHYPLIQQPIKRRLYKYLEHVGYWLGGTIVACGREEYEIILKEITFGNKKRLIHISNGIDIGQIKVKSYSTQQAPKQSKVRIGVAGRISEQKAPWVFANIARDVLSRRSDCEFIWIGGGDPPDVDLLSGAGVEVTGMLSRDEVLDKLVSLDIFLQTSAYEGLSLALLEAQAAGIPAVVTRIPGNDEVVQHEKTGYVGINETDMTPLLESLVDSPERRREMGRSARQYTQDHFSLSAMAEQYKQKYAEIVAQNTGTILETGH